MAEKTKPLFESDLLRFMRGPKAKRVTVQEWNGNEWVKCTTLDPSVPVVPHLLRLGLTDRELQQALDAMAQKPRRAAQRPAKGATRQSGVKAREKARRPPAGRKSASATKEKRKASDKRAGRRPERVPTNRRSR